MELEGRAMHRLLAALGALALFLGTMLLLALLWWEGMLLAGRATIRASHDPSAGDGVVWMGLLLLIVLVPLALTAASVVAALGYGAMMRRLMRTG